jgi:hypothetical protein
VSKDERWLDPHPWADDESIGVVYSEKRHRWAHAWSEYLVIMIGFFGLIAVLGSVRPFSLPRMAGALCVLAASFAISRSDRAHRSSPRKELIWAGVGVVLAVGGGTLFFTSM